MPLDRIDAVWAWISSDETGEGVLAAPIGPGGSIVPLVAADEARLASIRPWALAIGEASGRQIRLIRLSMREEIEVIENGGRSSMVEHADLNPHGMGSIPVASTTSPEDR